MGDMIYESWPWRRELERTANKIRKVQTYKRLREDTFAILERDIFVGFFSVRKLIDTGSKIDLEVSSMKLHIESFNATKPMGSYERFDFDDCYDLNNPYKVTKDISYLSNQFIHSLLMSFGTLREDGSLGVYFVSDKDRLKFCHYISLDAIARIFEKVANSHAHNLTLVKLEGGGRSFVSFADDNQS